MEINKGADCYDCVHYYARTFEGNGRTPRTIRLDACRLARKTRRMHPGRNVAETCPDYNIAATHEKK